MTVPFLLAAAGVFAAAPLEHMLRGLYGDAVAGAVTVGLLATVALAGAGWRRDASRAGEMPVAGWIAAGLLAAAVAGGPAGLPVVSRLLLAGMWFAFGLRAVTGKGLAAGLIAGGVAATVCALWQISGGLDVSNTALATLDRLDPALAERMRARLAQPRGFAFFVYPNVLGGYLIMALPFAAAWKETGGGFAATASLAVLGVGLLASGSIGAAGCAAAAALFTAGRRGRERTGWIAVFLAVGVLGAILLLRPGAPVSGGLAGRAALWAASLRPAGWLEAVIGAGPGRFGDLARDRVPAVAWSRHAHDWFAETFAETGILGLALLLWAVYRPLAGANAGRNNRDPWRRAAAAAWIAGGLHALIDIDYAVPVLIAPWWFLAGRLAADVTPPAKSRRAFTIEVPGWAVLALGTVGIALLRGPVTGVAAGALAGGAAGWLWYRRVTAGEMLPGSFWTDLPGLGLLGCAGLWVLSSPAMDGALRSAVGMAGFLALAAAARAVLARDAAAYRFRTAILAVGCAFSVWAVGEAVAGHTRGRGPFPSPNALASWLAFAAALAAGSLRANRAAVAAGAILAAGLVATGSNGGLAAAVIAVAVAVTVRTRSAGLIRVLLPAAAALVIAATLALRDGAPGGFHRLTMWREAARLVADDPGGHGPGRYADLAAKVRLPSATSAGVGRYSLAAEFAHCEPLQFAVEWGILPLGVLAWALLAAWRGSDPRRRGWWFALAAVGLHGLVDFPFRAPPVAVLVAIALGAATARRKTPAAAGRLAPLPVLLAVWCAVAFIRPGLSRVFLAAGRPAIALTLWPVSADAAGALGRDAAERALSLPGPTPGLVRAQEQLERAEALSGGRWTDALDLGRFLRERGRRLRSSADLDAADAALARASAGAPWSPDVLIERADLAASRRQWRDADGYLDAAAKCEPFCVAVAAKRAEFQARRGRIGDARRTISAAIILQTHSLQRPGLNDYERRLLGTPDAAELRHRLIGLEGTR